MSTTKSAKPKNVSTKKVPKPRSRKRVPVRDPNDPVYTHRDSTGLGWRMVGSRPVSALADAVMRDCGLPLLK